MIKLPRLLGLLLLVLQPATLRATDAARLSGDMILWYRQPAGKWLEAMPMGNGIMGAMVFGGIQHERIALNEGTFWSGRPHDYDNPQAIQYFPKIRDLVFAGKFQEAEKMADDHFFGLPKAQQAFQPLGDLLLTIDGTENASDYRRELNMETGVAKIQYRSGDAVFTREVFVSYPDRVLVLRLSCDKPGHISIAANLKSAYADKISAGVDQGVGKLVMDGSWKGPIPVKNDLIAPVEGTGLHFQTAMLARTEGGTCKAANDSLQIQGADAVTLVITSATSYVNYHDIIGNPAAACEKTLAGVSGKDYATLLQRHTADFANLMGRVHLSVGDAAQNQKPTDERLKALHDGAPDANLEALCFQFGRYALVSASRAGGQPANLQGIWDESVSPSWGSKYTININTEMNYWPTEVCNLSECHQPMFDMLKDISQTGAKTAKVQYGLGGWVAHHNIDLWRGTAPVDAARFGMWPVGGAWLCQDIWEHYAFTGDRAFLAEYYPVMKGSAEFLLELLTEEPKHHWLVTPFSMSPEHGYLDTNGKLCFLSPAPTMDIGIMRELFTHCISAGELLGVDEDFRAKLKMAMKRLPPYQINRQGHLQEWIEDWDAGKQGHNCSPNFPFYPGNSITLRGNPDLAAAIEKWMETRRPGGGFPSVWYISVWSRLERGDKAGAFITAFVANAVAPNMHNRGANQSDATFGFTAGVAESLLQSHAGEISLLPALSPGWKDGSVTGLRGRGGFDVSMQWKEGKLVSAAIRADHAGVCKVRYGSKTASVSFVAGQTIRLNSDLTPVT
ncbi:MAG TPA: glycoside hydrolase family 95 protein [Tepidisphaeraceae bacterium]|nr:glycoside hydrolase family 95 protein [Tepidisphaeraceae bacterium]